VITALEASARTIPTDTPESDGTLEWDSTTIVLVRAVAGEHSGLGYTYGDASIAALVKGKLANVVCGRDPMDVPGAWSAMRDALRNAGAVGAGAMAISAVDIALWDLKARILGVSLCTLLGRAHDGVEIYGSGGFTSYADDELAEQLAGWAAQAIPRVKMKVGREPDRDEHRVEIARAAIGDDVELMVDANGAYDRAQARRWRDTFAQHGVTWLEEPVSSDDPEGLEQLRGGPVAIAAGEYGWRPEDFPPLTGAVDVLQADVTRCQGITGLLAVSGLCEAHGLPLSAHCAPAISCHAFAALPPTRHLEYFHDHVRVEHMLFDGVPEPVGGLLRPDVDRPGHGLELKP
jgi:L-alanine-DL-glutamate epimerase-like enolase superfamily enzyme